MHLVDLARKMAENSDYTIASCKDILKIGFETIMQELEDHGDVRITGFGVFEVYERQARKMKIPNPTTGEDFQEKIIPARMYPKFTPSQILKDRVR